MEYLFEYETLLFPASPDALKAQKPRVLVLLASLTKDGSHIAEMEFCCTLCIYLIQYTEIFINRSISLRRYIHKREIYDVLFTMEKKKTLCTEIT